MIGTPLGGHKRGGFPVSTTMKTLVTGASGHLGANLVRALGRAGREVRALVRPTSDRRGLEGERVEVVLGDVLDRRDVERAVAGCARVFHAAAVYSVDDREREQIVATAVEGTRNVLEAAARAGVDRVVYTSSVATLGSSREPEPRDETAPAPRGGSAYVEAKVRAEEVARELAGEVPVVIVNPSVILGPWDFKPTPSTRLVARLLSSGGSPIHFRGGVNVVDARDAAEGHLLAESRGVPGERYILGGANVTFRQLLEEVAGLAGLRRPWLPVGRGMLLAAGSLAAVVARLRGSAPAASPARLRGLVGRFSWFTSEKAARELRWSARSFDQTIRDTVRWCLEGRSQS